MNLQSWLEYLTQFVAFSGFSNPYPLGPGVGSITVTKFDDGFIDRFPANRFNKPRPPAPPAAQAPSAPPLPAKPETLAGPAPHPKFANFPPKLAAPPKQAPPAEPPTPRPAPAAPPAPPPRPAPPAPPARPPAAPVDERIQNVAAPARSAGALSGGRPMLDSYNEYRERAGLPPVTWDDRLAANAAKTGRATGGKYMQHQMNPGTNGQVLAEGVDDAGKCGRDFAEYTPFEAILYSWLCEVPGDAALRGRCPKVFAISRIVTQGQTGHYKILSDPRFKRIGCAYTRDPSAGCGTMMGIWACDLAF